MNKKIILKGITACPGLTQGKVKIIKSPEDILKVKKEEIIVADFLDPDFVIFLKRNSKIKGIITDEGGATCHAAILAREFQIPYIAGLKTATKRFKNNMMIMLDGKEGKVYEV